MNEPTMRERFAVLRELYAAANAEQVWALLSPGGRARIDEVAMAMRHDAQVHAAQQRARKETP